MKKLVLIMTIVSLFFSVSAYASKDVVTDADKISSIINNYYPQLKDYYNAGVMSIESLTEQTLGDGSTEYDIKYKFVKNYYGQDEINNVLKEQYPDIYMMSKAELVKDISIYRFVDKATGKILTNVAYNRNIPNHRPIFFRHR